MKRFHVIPAVVFAVLSLSLNVAMAADSCSDWVKQSDGSYWRTCVDDKGQQYCQASVNNRVTKVSCRTGKPVAANAPLVAPILTGNPASLTGGIANTENIQSDLQVGFADRISPNNMAADTHADQCMANYKQCMKGCDGATSCSNQCQINYDNCMKQNQ